MNVVRILRKATFVAAVIASVAAPGIPFAAPAPIPPLPTPALLLPAPVERTLPNGLRVVVFPVARLPIVQVQLLVPAGSAEEPENQPGVAALTAALLRQDTPSRVGGQLADDFAQAGATFATTCLRDYALVACGARAEAFESAIEVMSDAVLNPLFGGDGFADARGEEARRAAGMHGSLADAVDTQLGAQLFGAHPYAHDPAVDPRLLSRLDLATVQAFHRDRWRPDRAVLVIAGDVSPDRAFAAASDWFGRWAGRTTADRARPAVQAATGVHLFDTPGGARVEVRVAVPGPGLASPAHDAWALAFGAFESTRLPEGARARTWEARDASALVISASVPPGQAVATTQAIVHALQSCAATPPTGEALAALRRRVAQHYPLTLGTLGAFVGQWQALDFAGAPAGAIATLGERQAAADLAEGLARLAAPPVVLVAGPAATLRAPLEAAGLGAVRLESETGPRAGAAEDSAPVTPEMRRRGKAAVAAAVTAHGGVAALAGVKSLVMEGTITLRMGGQDMAGQFSAVRQDPDRYSFGTKVMNLESRQVCRGSEGWSFLHAESTYVKQLDSVGVNRLHASAASDLVHELRMASAAGADPVWRGTELVAERTCDLVDYATPFGRQRLSIDAETHRVLEISSSQAARGQWLDRRVLSDFRKVNALLLPYVEERSVRGERTWRMTAMSVGTNMELPKVLFDRPAIDPDANGPN